MLLQARRERVKYFYANGLVSKGRAKADTWRTGTRALDLPPVSWYDTLISNQTDGTPKNWWH
jgi:hypothetical protein